MKDQYPLWTQLWVLWTCTINPVLHYGTGLGHIFIKIWVALSTRFGFNFEQDFDFTYNKLCVPLSTRFWAYFQQTLGLLSTNFGSHFQQTVDPNCEMQSKYEPSNFTIMFKTLPVLIKRLVIIPDTRDR